VYLVNDENLVFSMLRLKPHLLDECSDMLDSVVGCGIQLSNVERCILMESLTGGTGVAWLKLWSWFLTVQDFSQNSGTGGFPNSPWATKKKRMSQMILLKGIPQSPGHMRLAYNFIKPLWSVFSGGYNKLAHGFFPSFVER